MKPKPTPKKQKETKQQYENIKFLLCCPTTSELGADFGESLIYPGILLFKKILFFPLCQRMSVANGILGLLCPPNAGTPFGMKLCTLFVRCLSLWAHMCISPVVCGRHDFFFSPTIYDSYYLLPLPCRPLHLEELTMKWRHPIYCQVLRSPSHSTYCPVVHLLWTSVYC